MIVRTRVLQDRSVNGVKIRLEDDPDDPADYRVTITRTFDDYITAMDYVRQIEREARQGYVYISDQT